MSGPDLVLVRHARSLPVPGLAPSSWPLVAGAMEATAALGMALASVTLERGGGGAIDLVVSSHEVKAVATARSLAHSLGTVAITAPGLEEHRRPDAGLLEQSEFEATMRRFFASPEALVFGDETASEARERFRTAILALRRERPDSRSAIVTHGTVMTLLLAAPNSLEPYALWRSLRMPEAVVVRSSDWRIVQRLALEE